MTGARQDFASDFSIEQNWQNYSAEEHAVWRLLGVCCPPKDERESHAEQGAQRYPFTLSRWPMALVTRSR